MLNVVIAAAGLPAAAASLYLLVLALASFRRQRPPRPAGPPPRLAVLVPAHDEEELVGRCVGSLRAQTYPTSRYRVVVIADNCGDRTAEVAGAAGAEVYERRDDRLTGKGHALRWAMDRLLAEPEPPDAVVVVDADSIAGRDLLAHLAAALADGADAAQAEYLVLADGESTRARLVAGAFLLFHRVRFGGRAALGLPASLVGNGMLFSRRLLETHPWNAFTGVEDLEYTIDLRLAGVRPRFVAAATVEGPVPHGYRGMRGQRMRWEGGRWHVVRGRLLPLLGHALRRDPGVMDAVIDLAVPPLGLLAMGAMAGTAVAAAAVALRFATAWSLSPWLLAVVALTAFVVLGLLSARAPASVWLALLESPRFLVWKALTYSRLARGFDPRRWERADRSRAGAGPPVSTDAAQRCTGGRVRGGYQRARVQVGGVPIDRLDMTGAMALLRDALAEGRQVQVATVNLDFLVRARRHPELRAVLTRSELNVADGMPVVWLSRLLGRPVPSRVAGADMAPRLVAEAAARDAGVFLLGGENGVTEIAARRLMAEHPGLRVSWYAPPRARLEEMDSDHLVELVVASGAQVLLVALGNPKQELWIARHRHRLPQVSIAVGVGCVFDLWAGRVRRAPAWMRRTGLEWLHRLMAEPNRLAGRHATGMLWLLVLAGGAVLERARPGR
ncbi:MAG TPA: WecB/TagA/CpsF family glycosyltransferase [Candidatus Dormibacteraeota bacterium]